MPKWSDEGRTLTLKEAKEMLRDGCASLGKCGGNSDIAKLVQKSPADLYFDDPPLGGQPNLQKKALYLIVRSYLVDANIDVPTNKFNADYFVKNAGKPLSEASSIIHRHQQYPLRDEEA